MQISPNKKERWIFIGLILGYVLMIIGAILKFNANLISPYIFTAGAIFTIVSRLFGLPQSSDFRVKRLNNLVALGVLALAGAVYLIWEDKGSWIIALTISVFIDLYTSFRYPKKDDKTNKKE